jgi:DNA-binding Xre family transcriptional regulator
MAERGLEISDLAKLAGLRIDTVHKVVRGIARDIPLSTLVKLALALECNLEIRFSET